VVRVSWVPFLFSLSWKKVMSLSGRKVGTTAARRPVMRAVEMKSCHFKALPTVATVILKKWMQSTERNEAQIPTLVMISGK
jgi:hypothetical protein